MKHAALCFLLLFSTSLFAQQAQSDLNFLKLPFVANFENKTTKISDEDSKGQEVVILRTHTEMEYYMDAQGDLKKSYGFYIRYKILSNEGIQSNKNVSIPVSSETDIIATSLNIIQPDNSFKKYGIKDFKKLENEGSQVFIHAYEGLTVGSEIEMYYLINSNVGLYGSLNLSSNYVNKIASFGLISPEKLVFAAKGYNVTASFTDNVKDGKRYLEITEKDLKNSKKELYSLEDATEPRIEYSFYYNKERQNETMQTWNLYAGNIMKTLLNEKEASQKSFLKIIKAEKLQGLDEKSTIRNIENYVKSTINIDKEAPTAPLVDVFKNKYANELVVQKLFATLFELTNVKYEAVIGSSKLEKVFDESFVSWSFLDAIFFYFPESNQYLSTTNPFVRVGYPENEFSDTKALFIETLDLGGVKTYVGQVKEIEDVDCKTNEDFMEISVSLDKQLEAVNFTYMRSFGGQMVNNLKGYYDNASSDKKEEFRTNIIKSFTVQDIEIKSSSVQNFELNTDNWPKPMIFKAEVSSKILLEQAGPKLFLKIGELIGSQSELYDENERRNEINIGNQHGYLRNISVKIPEGYEIANLEDINMNFVCMKGKEKLCEFVSSYVIKGNVLDIKIDENYCKTQLPKSVYPAFQKVINAAADWNKVVLVIQKK
jgi:hypothetical protein